MPPCGTWSSGPDPMSEAVIFERLVETLEAEASLRLAAENPELLESLAAIDWEPLRFGARIEGLLQGEGKALELAARLRSWEGDFEAAEKVLDQALDDAAIHVERAALLHREAAPEDAGGTQLATCVTALADALCVSLLASAREGAELRLSLAAEGRLELSILGQLELPEKGLSTWLLEGLEADLEWSGDPEEAFRVSLQLPELALRHDGQRKH